MPNQPSNQRDERIRTIEAARLLSLVSLFWLTAVAAGVAEDVQWRSGSMPAQKLERAALRSALATLDADETHRHIVVRFDTPITSGQRADLEAAGVRLLSYVGGNAFFAVLSGEGLDAKAAAAVGSLADVRAVERTWKLHRAFASGETPSWAVLPGNEGDAESGVLTVAAYVLFHRDVALVPDGMAVAERHGAFVRSQLHSINGLVIELPADNVTGLADEDAVQWIEPPLPTFSKVNDHLRQLTQVDVLQADPMYLLDGAGVTAMVYDGGMASAEHPDFGGRLTTHDDTQTRGHPTHVAGTIGGSGFASGGQYRGMAPGILMRSYAVEVAYDGTSIPLYADPGDLEVDYADAINLRGADLANNSIGTNLCSNGFDCEVTGDYGVTAHLIDAIVTGSLGEPFRIIWAAGNERGCNRCRDEGVHTREGYRSIAPPAGAKNHITVGAVNANDDSVAIFSSWGPTDDGRLKPDLVAPGCEVADDFGVTSTALAGGYAVACGTSMSTPAVTGAAALLIQDYRSRFPEADDPRNAMLKALFAHTAQDLGSIGPDFQSGYGSVRAKDAIDFMRTANFREAQVGQGAVYIVLAQVDVGDTQLRVTLAWDDVPATPNVANTLVNDLDLRVYDPSGVRHFPWTLDPIHPSAPAERVRPDHRNNLEQVVVDGPGPGMWLVEVFGYRVPEAPQAFAICVTPSIPLDCNGNSIPDEQELAADPSLDCSGNGILDECEPDSNGNGLVDSCEIVEGLAEDCNNNGLVDDCEPDCNGNGQPDECDVLDGISPDCNGDGIPDDCEPDCNSNGVADSCDVQSGTSGDCDHNGVPDECQDTTTDCNNNGLWDGCDTGEGISEDFNSNRIPDECEDRAHIWYVDASNCPGPGVGTLDDPFCTIQAGIDAAITGNTVVVMEGIYTGAGNRDLDYARRLITVQSRDPENWEVVRNTIIDAAAAGRAFYFHSGESREAVVDGLTIRNGLASVGNTPGAYRGGAVYCLNSSPTIRRCLITDNEVSPTIFAQFGGGAVHCERSSPAIHQCVIADNVTTNPGGAIYCLHDSHADIRGCLIYGNEAYSGGGIASFGSHPTVRHCTIADNVVQGSWGGGVYCPSGNPTIEHTILWGNVAREGPNQIYGEPMVSFSLIESGWAGVGNRDEAPQFVQPAVGDYHLSPDSPCVNAGDPSLRTSTLTDLDGEPRVFGPRVDIGADEFVDLDCNDNGIEDAIDIAALTSRDCNDNGVPDECEMDCNNNGHPDDCDIADGWSADYNLNGIPDECEPHRVIYVDDDAPHDPGPGDPGVSDTSEDGSRRHPYDAIQEGIDATQDGDEVVLLAGLYRGVGNRDLDYGGKLITVRSADGPATCVIDAEELGRGLIFHTAETPAARIVGITIRNGLAERGGGIACRRSSPSIRDCVFQGNTAERGGGAVYADDSSPVITGCTIQHNRTEAVGGGGIYSVGGNPSIRHCVIAENHASYYGGGLYSVDGAPLIDNCVIARNSAASGGGIYATISQLRVMSCTLADNSAAAFYGSHIHLSSGTAHIANSIVWSTTPSARAAVYVSGGATVAVEYSAIINGSEGLFGQGTASSGDGILVGDPLFVDAAHFDYHLLPQSPCIDAGDPHYAPPELVAVDVDGEDRIMGGRLDMGADEYNPDCNGNGKPDSRDLAEGTCRDCNGNHIPDECESDCNADGIEDSCEIREGIEDDCNYNGVPDGCEYLSGDGADMNANGVLDECERCTEDWDCDDGRFCNGAEVCVESTCEAGNDPCPGQMCREDLDQCVECADSADCDDGNECTQDSCIDGMCEHTPYLSPCDDADRCTINDYCVDGTCTGTAVPDCGARFTLRAVQLNGSDIVDGPVDRVVGQPGDILTTELFINNWQPQQLSVFQVTIDSSGYRNAPFGGLAPLDEPGPTAGAFINHGRADFVFHGISAITGVSVGHPDYQYGGIGLLESAVDIGVSAYCGTLILTIDHDAAGSFTIGFVADPGFTFLLERSTAVLAPYEFIPLEVYVDIDCNGNGIADDEEIASGVCADCTGNGVPDECEPDCNENGIADSCDLLSGVSGDCNANGIPDECDDDCNGNGVADSCDVASGDSADCNENGIPDECDTATGGGSLDCNSNGQPDECEEDCNRTSIPDDCDIDSGASKDCNFNGIPDECEPDCNNNGRVDACDIAAGESTDSDLNGIPDECQSIRRVPAEYATIQEAVDAANPGDLVLLADHVYAGPGNRNIELRGKVLTLRCENGPEHCIIDGGESDRGLWIHEGEGPTTRIEGITITRSAMGVWLAGGAGPDMVGCHIVGNVGSGMYVSTGASPTIRRCVVSGNAGRGVYCYGSTPVIEDSLITDNASYAVSGGGGAELSVTNCTLAGNGNSMVLSGCSANIDNCIVWGNGGEGSSWAYLVYGASMGVTYSDLEGGEAGVYRTDGTTLEWGSGNSNVSPSFVNPAEPAGGFETWENNDYHLAADSPCIDAGNPEMEPDEGRQDIDGQPRVMFEAVDVGADEVNVFVDCNENGTLDGHDIESGASADCNDNRVPDECDIEDGSSPDCNGNGVPDECDVISTFTAWSGELSPIGHGFPQSYVVADAPEAVGDVVVRFSASADLNGWAEYLEILVNGTRIERVFDIRGSACPSWPDEAEIVVPAEVFNVAAGGGDVVIDVVASDLVNAYRCYDPAYVAVSVKYSAAGDSQDADGNGVPDECELAQPWIVASEPPDGAIDARQPHAWDNADDTVGWESIRITFDRDVRGVQVTDFAVSEVGGYGPTTEIAAVDIVSATTVQIMLSHAIAPGTWTRITHTASGAGVCLGYLPGDVNSDGVVTASDIAALIDSLNGTEGRERPIYCTDIDRSGLARAHDVLRLVDLLNGAGAYRPWITETLPPSPCTGP